MRIISIDDLRAAAIDAVETLHFAAEAQDSPNVSAVRDIRNGIVSNPIALSSRLLQISPNGDLLFDVADVLDVPVTIAYRIGDYLNACIGSVAFYGS